jgi:hypothetical protein
MPDKPQTTINGFSARNIVQLVALFWGLSIGTLGVLSDFSWGMGVQAGVAFGISIGIGIAMIMEKCRD